MIDHYDWAGGREAMLRFGPQTGPVVVFALPLLEEANRTRAFVVTILRALAARGIAGALPDLPGQGESMLTSATMTATQLREAYAAAADMLRGQGLRPYAAGVRSGALLDALAVVGGRWHLAPATGPDTLRAFQRISEAAGTPFDPLSDEQALPIIVAGNVIDPLLLHELRELSPIMEASTRTVRLETDPARADRHVPGAPPWRRAEPGNDPALAAILADDIAQWIARCEG